MWVRCWAAVAAAVVGGSVLAGCGAEGASGDAPSGSSPGSSKTVICGRALGIVLLSEAGDDAERKARRARETADALRELAGETKDASLSSALRAAAAEAGEVTQHEWSGDRLRAWAAKEQERFTALRDACS